MLVSIMLVGKFVSNNGVLEYGVRARVLYGKLQGFLWFRVQGFLWKTIGNHGKRLSQRIPTGSLFSYCSLTGISENFRRPPGVHGRMQSRNPVHPVSITRFPSFRTQTLENLSVDSVNKWIPEQPRPWRKSCERESCYADRAP